MAKKDRTPAQQKKIDDALAFARLYLNPSGGTYRNQRKTFLALFPECDDKNVDRAAWRYTQRPLVQKALAETAAKIQAQSDMGSKEYLDLCLENLAVLRDKIDIPGVAGAIPKMIQLIGDASGHLVRRTKDETPRQPEALNPIATAQAILEAAERMKRLSEPNPVQALPAVDVEFTILPGENIDGSK